MVVIKIIDNTKNILSWQAHSPGLSSSLKEMKRTFLIKLRKMRRVDEDD
jgi:hypothetical protein